MAPQNADRTAAAQRRAFVLDDEVSVGAYVAQVLTNNGFAASAFSTQMEMLVKLRPVPPDLIILDLALGQSDAVDAIRQLSTLKFAGHILLMSGRDATTLREIEQIGLRYGLNMLPSLRKPFRSQALLESLNAPPLQKDAGLILDLEETASASFTLGQALQSKWLELWYQPKIDLKSLSVVGAEALLRARHPRQGILAPAQMLPQSESALYQDLYKFVVGRVAADWAYFSEVRPGLLLSINLPVSTVCAPDFVGNLRALLPRDTRYPGLIIEVGGDVLLRDPQRGRDVASQLKLYNVYLSIDDFGLSHDSISRLTDLPCVEVKLERTFVDGCASDKNKSQICKLMIDLAHRSGVNACAVGVERVEDLRALIALGCDTAQGFLFARPAEPNQFLTELRKGTSDNRAA